MLTSNLKKEWFEKIKSGQKTHEYREVKPYWTKRLTNELQLSKFEDLEMYRPPYSQIVRFVKGYINYISCLILSLICLFSLFLQA